MIISIRPAFKEIYGAIAGVLAPRRCLVCGRITQDEATAREFICGRCIDRLPYADSPELVRSRMFENFPAENLRIDRVCALFSLRDDFDYMEIIYFLKYHGFTRAGEELGRMLGRRLHHEGMDEIDYIIPVPIHRTRQRERGFNQSQLIAEGIAQETAAPVCNNIIKRIRYTKTQTALNATERMKNVAAAFDLDRPDIVGGRRLLLVDDVLTTGSTLNACAMTLAGANPESISAATIAVA